MSVQFLFVSGVHVRAVQFLVLFVSLNLFNLICEGVEKFSSYGNACDLYSGCAWLKSQQ